MQPIILISIIAVTAVAMGSGFLSNGIDLWVQQFGVEEEDITSPVSHAQIDFNIVKTVGNQGFFKNVITDCIVTLDKTVGQLTDMNGVSVLTPSMIQCKLTDSRNNIIAEGQTVATVFPGGVKILVPIDDPLLSASDVQNVHDVKLVVKANTHS